MQFARKMTINSAIIFLNRMIDPLISIVLIIYLARMLTKNELGEYSFIRSYLGIFVVISGLGLYRPLIREIAKNKAEAAFYFVNAAFLGFGFSIIMALVACAIIAGVNHFYVESYPREVLIGTCILSFSLLYSTINEYSHSVAAAYEKFEYDTLITLLGSLIKTNVSILLLIKGYGLLMLLVVLVVTGFLQLLGKLIMVQHLAGAIPLKIDFKIIKRFIRVIPTFTFISILSVIYWRMDILMLSKMAGMSAVAIYAAAYRLMDICKRLPLSITQAMFPSISNISKFGQRRLQHVSNQVFKWTALLIIPIAFGTYILANEIIFLFYKDKFAESTLVLQILIWTIVPYGLAMVLANLLVANNKQKYDLWVNIFAFGINIGLNYFLIQKYSYVGAATATLISVIFFFALQNYFVSKHLFPVNYFKFLYKPVFASIGMAFFIKTAPLRMNQLFSPVTLNSEQPVRWFLIQNAAAIDLFLMIMLGIIVYLAILMLLKTFSQAELQFIKVPVFLRNLI